MMTTCVRKRVPQMPPVRKPAERANIHIWGGLWWYLSFKFLCVVMVVVMEVVLEMLLLDLEPSFHNLLSDETEDAV